ncbi:MAG: methylated-DNA--[protein]-cysteine S-methyltransferase [Gammaproteobacteria bacterium]|nr:methylated-DNA--[protein]-cysteine S-methyltransferase [Gammaproteobacteria bacterium]
MNARRPVSGTCSLDTSLGTLGMRWTHGRLRRLWFYNVSAAPPSSNPAALAGEPVVQRAIGALRAYFRRPAAFPRLPLAPEGTSFQQRVWRALCAIPPGQSRCYGELARSLGTGSRAVGGACRANPIPILIPCHRVVAATGTGGYSQGLARKDWLLRHEGHEGHEGILRFV